MAETHEQDWEIYERVMNPGRVRHVSTGIGQPGRSWCFRDSRIRSNPSPPPPQSTFHINTFPRPSHRDQISSPPPPQNHHRHHPDATPYFRFPPPTPPEDDFMSRVMAKYDELVAADKAARALAAAPPPLHHQSAVAVAARPQPPPTSESPSDLLRSQVTTSPPPSSFPSPSPSPLPFAKTTHRIRETSPPPPSRFPSTTHSSTALFPTPVRIRTPTSDPSLRRRTPSQISAPSLAIPLCNSPNSVRESPAPTSRDHPYLPEPPPQNHSPAADIPPGSRSPLAKPSPPPPPVRGSLPQPRAFPSLLPCRETLTVPSSPASAAASHPPPPFFPRCKSPPSLSPGVPVPVPPPPTHEFQQQQSISEKQKSDLHRDELGEAEIRNQKETDSLPSSYTGTNWEKTMGKKLYCEQIAVPEKNDIEDEKDTVLFSVPKKQKDTVLFSVPEKKNKIQTLLFEQKLEYELILIEYVDSPPTSDVSTIRGRIVFKKGRVIPYIIGPNGGRARPPRARIKDRELSRYKCLCVVFVFVVFV